MHGGDAEAFEVDGFAVLEEAVVGAFEGEHPVVEFHCEVTAVESEFESATALAVDEHYVTFSVIDTGCGIPKGKENSIFEKFEKGSETSTGSGLGLFICRSISNQLYGQLYFDASYTRGAKFVFQHPTMLQSMMSDQVKE